MGNNVASGSDNCKILQGIPNPNERWMVLLSCILPIHRILNWRHRLGHWNMARSFIPSPHFLHPSRPRHHHFRIRHITSLSLSRSLSLSLSLSLLKSSLILIRNTNIITSLYIVDIGYKVQAREDRRLPKTVEHLPSFSRICFTTTHIHKHI